MFLVWFDLKKWHIYHSYFFTANNVTTQQKERRPRKPQTTTYHPQNLSQSNLSSEKCKTNNNQTQTIHLVQTKSAVNDTKLYPQFLIIEQQQQEQQQEQEQIKSATESTHNEQESSASSSSTSSQFGYYAIVDGRLVYTTAPAASTTPDTGNSSNNTTNQMQTSGHLYLTNTGELIIAAESAAQHQQQQQQQSQINKNEQETQVAAQAQHYAISAIKNETINNVIASPQKQSPVAQSASSSSYTVYNSPGANSLESQQQEHQNIHYTSDGSGHVIIYKTSSTANRQTNQTTATGTGGSGGSGGGGGTSGSGSGGGSVAYSSVITRATGEQTKVYKQQQQQTQQQSPHQQQQQSWWENEGKLMMRLTDYLRKHFSTSKIVRLYEILSTLRCNFPFVLFYLIWIYVI